MKSLMHTRFCKTRPEAGSRNLGIEILPNPVQCSLRPTRSEVPPRRSQVRLRPRGPRRGGEAAVPGQGEEEHQGAPGGARPVVHEQGGLLHPRPGQGENDTQPITVIVTEVGYRKSVTVSDRHSIRILSV